MRLSRVGQNVDVNFAKGLEAWAVAEGLTVDTTGHVEARILRALRALATVAGQGGFVAFNNEVLTLLTTIAAAGGGGGDAASVGGFTPGTAGGAVLESETAAAVRTAAELGTAAVEAVGTATPQWTGGTASQVLMPGRSANLCETGAIADLIANCPADWLAVDGGGKMTASRASDGTVSFVRTTTGSDNRQGLTMPRIQLQPQQAGNYRFTCRVAVPNTGGGLTYFGGGPFIHTGHATASNPYFGAFAWQTNFQPWDPVTAAIQTITIAAGAYIWYRLTLTGTTAHLWYSTSTAEPTRSGTSSPATEWAYAGRSELLPGISAAAQLLPFVVGLGPISLTGGTEYTVTATCCRIEWW